MKEGDYLQSIHSFQEQILLQQLQSQNMNMNNTNMIMTSSDHVYGGGGAGLVFPSEVSPWSIPQVHPFLPPPPYGGPASGLSLFNRSRIGNQQQFHSSFQFAYDGSSPSTDHHNLRLLSEALGPVMPFGCDQLGKMSAQEIMDAKALAASKSHSEAERKRRERINNHLAKLRSLLPSAIKTDKASLLAEVIQHVKELKRQTAIISETTLVPTEADELTVDALDDEYGKLVIKASICCEDRPELLSDLIKTLKALKLKTLKAEFTTLGGRVESVLFITEDDEQCSNSEDVEDIPMHYSISSIREALKSVMEKSGGSSEDGSAGSVKRQRTNNSDMNISMLENMSVKIMDKENGSRRYVDVGQSTLKNVVMHGRIGSMHSTYNNSREVHHHHHHHHHHLKQTLYIEDEKNTQHSMRLVNRERDLFREDRSNP